MNPETLELARLQFALTAGTHFLFVALTIGLATLLVGMQTVATLTGRPADALMVRFWGQLYVINYAVGIVTGLVMEFQFGLSWSGLSHFAGNVFGSALAMETLVAFFLESTFLGLWIFGWNRLNRWVHLALLWLITLTSYASAYWILVANGFLNNPVGFRRLPDQLAISDVFAVLTNPSSIQAFWHIFPGSVLTAGFFVAGISGLQLMRRTPHRDMFRKSLRVGVYVTIPALITVVLTGGFQFELLSRIRPGSFGEDEFGGNGWAIAGLSLMVLTWTAMFGLAFLNNVLAAIRPAAERFAPWHLILIVAIPMPYVAMISGWVFRESSRQPWAIFGVLKTSDAVSTVPFGQMLTSFIVFTVLFGLLTIINGWLLWRAAIRGPDAVLLGRTEASPPPPTGPPAPPGQPTQTNPVATF